MSALQTLVFSSLSCFGSKSAAFAASYSASQNLFSTGLQKTYVCFADACFFLRFLALARKAQLSLLLILLRRIFSRQACKKHMSALQTPVFSFALLLWPEKRSFRCFLFCFAESFLANGS